MTSWADKTLEKRGHVTKYHRLQPPSWEEQQAQAEWLEEEFDKCFRPYDKYDIDVMNNDARQNVERCGDWYEGRGSLESRIELGGYYRPRQRTHHIRPMFETYYDYGEYPFADEAIWDAEHLYQYQPTPDASRWPKPFPQDDLGGNERDEITLFIQRQEAETEYSSTLTQLFHERLLRLLARNFAVSTFPTEQDEAPF